MIFYIIYYIYNIRFFNNSKKALQPSIIIVFGKPKTTLKAYYQEVKHLRLTIKADFKPNFLSDKVLWQR